MNKYLYLQESLLSHEQGNRLEQAVASSGNQSLVSFFDEIGATLRRKWEFEYQPNIGETVSLDTENSQSTSWVLKVIDIRHYIDQDRLCIYCLPHTDGPRDLVYTYTILLSDIAEGKLSGWDSPY